MGRKPRIDLTDTYVMDDEVMDEMENLEATAVLLDGFDDALEPDDHLEPDDEQDLEGTTVLIKPK